MDQKYLQELAAQRKEILADIEYLRQLLVDNELHEDTTTFHDVQCNMHFNDHKIQTVISYTLVTTFIKALEHDLYNCDVCMVGVSAADAMNPSHTDMF